jgi:hypothetical protein
MLREMLCVVGLDCLLVKFGNFKGNVVGEMLWGRIGLFVGNFEGNVKIDKKKFLFFSFLN